MAEQRALEQVHKQANSKILRQGGAPIRCFLTYLTCSNSGVKQPRAIFDSVRAFEEVSKIEIGLSSIFFPFFSLFAFFPFFYFFFCDFDFSPVKQ